MTSRRPARRRAAAFLVFAMMAPLAGCYERVVSTNRPASHRGNIHESNLESSRGPGLDEPKRKPPPRTDR